ncbi:MAG: DEAD/DEAH box helicase [Pseudomonadota bacterium]
MTEFEGVIPALGQALSKRGYSVLTPVQEAVLAPELSKADVLVSAQTGSGKTVAFGLTLAPTLLGGADRFSRAKAPLALAVAPTRELALQVRRELEWLYEMTGAFVASCVGGMDMRAERRALERGAHIVVGTPGRLRDHIERGFLNMTELKAVVLDEADEMLDMGFRDDLEYILGSAPAERRTLLYSATVPRSIASLAARYQRDAVRITTSAEQKQHLDIEYRALTIAPNDQENAIINVLRYFEAKNALVFCSTRATVNHMTSRFTNRGLSVVALSGELSQNERSHALQAMRDGRARVCIATDVAARGLDLPNLELVIHADLPKNRESLLHRSGRTGRAGRKGVSVLIVPHSAGKRTERLLQSANIRAAWAKPPSADEIMRRDDERILADPALSEPLKEGEQAFAQELLARHGAEQVAAAFVRLYRAGQSAPEELRDTAPAERKTKQRDDFKGGVWFSLSVGRKQSAEPRWLLPMLCRAGNISKREIGAIRIDHYESLVELAPGCVEKFLEAVGPSRRLEKTITVTRLDGAPEELKGPRDKPRANKKKPYAPKPGAQTRPGPERKIAQKPDEPSGDQIVQGRPIIKAKGKKSHKPKFAKAGAKDRNPDMPGANKPKRKKPKNKAG